MRHLAYAFHVKFSFKLCGRKKNGENVEYDSVASLKCMQLDSRKKWINLDRGVAYFATQ